MRIVEELSQIKPERETLLTIGVFDGVHIGHQALLTRLRDEAREKGLLSGVVTFRCHPQKVLHPEHKLMWLSDLNTRVELIRALGINFVIPLAFTQEIAKLGAKEFAQLLKEHLKMRGLVVGPDFALGRNREGNARYLKLLGEEIGFTVEAISPVVVNGDVISSSAIRAALANGDVAKVQRLFGRPFSLTGKVVAGDQRGRTLGFPTANIDVGPDQALPGDGVYVTVAHVGKDLLPSVTNIGVRPTFGSGERLVETYIMDYDGKLKGRRLTIELVDKLRDEKRFGSVDELKAQMAKDVSEARNMLEKRAEKEG
ncbi:MAG: bifunctional riboflavin kinase/FAD synthetase [Chloroflexi bacterium]|nr:bifunctional riboflavin kinase/FAD synthetase [Chloroflexota bacterium]MBM3172198.1 bifunctional riboflavin kinase/FAD synthetase [Chloroflexota bacterium]MBM3174318.1 bifunctional riboflavin kinase/FAD synthetase [Chloroflexota bacterium]MBM4449449.1 bifunctional riboflavin kinase/FAD synthetase [Chloroflexota bacterium]